MNILIWFGVPHFYNKAYEFQLNHQSQVFLKPHFWLGKSICLFPVATLGLLIPETELFLRNKVSEMVALAAALDATLVGGASCR